MTISTKTDVKPDGPGAAKPWNLGKLIGQKPPLKLREVWAIRIRLQIQECLRDLAMFNLAIDSKLRGCDLVALRVDDVLLGGKVRPRATVYAEKDRPPGAVRDHRTDPRDGPAVDHPG